MYIRKEREEHLCKSEFGIPSSPGALQADFANDSDRARLGMTFAIERVVMDYDGGMVATFIRPTSVAVMISAPSRLEKMLLHRINNVGGSFRNITVTCKAVCARRIIVGTASTEC